MFEVKACETIVISKPKFKNKFYTVFTNGNKFCIGDILQYSKEEILYYIIEYDENMSNGKFGVVSHIVTKDELYNMFDYYGSRSELESD